MHYFIALAILLGTANASILRLKRGANGDQNPKVWDALAKLRGKDLSIEQIQDLYTSVVPGTDFPMLNEIPQANVDCASFKQPGFYADVDAGRCQVFHRCDIEGKLTSYLCPVMTLFNQITLVCDWWYNIDCSQEKAFYDYSNSRLYQEGLVLLDNQDEILAATGAVQASAPASSSSKASSKSKSESNSKAKAPSGAAKDRKSKTTSAPVQAAPVAEAVAAE